METVYVIAVKHLFDYKGNALDCWEYVDIDRSCGGYSSLTKSINGAEHFSSIGSAQKWFNDIGRGLIFYGKVKGQYDLNSLCIKSVTFRDPVVNFVKDLDFRG